MAAYPGWERAVLRAIGAPVTPSNVRFLSAWQLAEGQDLTLFNPLNTTQPMPGAKVFNSAGVRIYRNALQGTKATAKTLLNGNYDNVVQGLKQSAHVEDLAHAVGASPWGTSGQSILRVLGEDINTPAPATQGRFPAQVPAPPEPVSLQTTIRSEAQKGLRRIASGQDSPVAALGELAATAARSSRQTPLQELGAPPAPGVQVEAGSTPRDRNAVDLIHSYLGTPYKWGGAAPGGFDCSGLVQFVWGKLGVSVPRTTYEQFKAGKPVKGALRAGDAVFFRAGPNGPEHEGMYIGGGKFIEAPHSGSVVRVSKLSGRKDYVGARRFA